MADLGLIKALRERTGAGLNDCKKALDNSNNDVEAAAKWLREQGIAKSAKKANRIAAEGIADYAIDGNNAVIVEVNCETDFVAKGDRFHNLVKACRDEILKNKYKTVEDANSALQSLFTDATVAIGEKLSLRRFKVITKNDNECFGGYIHMGGKIASLVVINKDNKEVADNLAVHVAANNPQYICPKCIPADVIAQEKEIALSLAKQDEKLMSKPQAIIDKIIEGKVTKTLSEVVLHQQLYVFDDSKNVATYLKENGDVSVIEFTRYQVGEGIEKRKDDFAAEVMEQAK